MTETAASPAPHLLIRGLSKRYGSAAVLDGIELAVAPGELLTLLGPSGCGKTTLLRTIAGLVQPDRGVVSVAGQDITRLPPHRRNIGVVFQNYALFPHLSVRGNVAFGLSVRRRPKAEVDAAVSRVLALVHLEHLADRPVTALSGGQQQRVALARALAVQPTILLFDEALSALDRKLREEMQVELRSLLREIGATAIFVTHDQDEALTMSDRIAVMNAGRIEQHAEPQAIYARPATLFVLDFIGQSSRLSGVVAGSPAPGMVLVDTPAGRLQAPANFAPGSPVVIAVRPEHLQVVAGTTGMATADTDAAGTILRGRLHNAVYHGARTLLQVAAGEALLAVEVPGSFAVPAAGTDVAVHWPLHESFVYPAPAGSA